MTHQQSNYSPSSPAPPHLTCLSPPLTSPRLASPRLASSRRLPPPVSLVPFPILVHLTPCLPRLQIFPA
ncbi:hypothetical protein E2C01_100301 [Portunus trituberculatus]|uniref:Uncharacterized protein n=1 Tax=Portunus trituberculatus TaxID=210409 RepID=A0A5B7KJ44_PORTR|nr:hypothetical protein [Portunus trituberculatus]